jgi:hypothetical protein
VTLVLSKNEPELIIWLNSEITKRLAQENPPDGELLDDTARELRRTAISFRRREFEFNPIHREMGALEPDQLRGLLTEVADLLSPVAEHVDPDFSKEKVSHKVAQNRDKSALEINTLHGKVLVPRPCG